MAAKKQDVTRAHALSIPARNPQVKAPRSATHRAASRCAPAIQGQTMPGKDKMEIEIAFKALAFFAAFMAARSLTAYFKKK